MTQFPLKTAANISSGATLRTWASARTYAPRDNPSVEIEPLSGVWEWVMPGQHRRVKNQEVEAKMKLLLKDVRLAFPALFTPTAVGDGAPRYGAKFIVAPKSPTVEDIDAAVKTVAEQKWPKNYASILEDLNAKGKSSWLKAAYKDKNGEPYSGFENTFSIGANRKVAEGRPLVIDRQKNPLTETDGKPYAGCYVNATVDLWAQDNQFGRRINATLLAVQFLRDGDAFSGAAPANVDEFDDLGVEEELA